MPEASKGSPPAPAEVPSVPNHGGASCKPPLWADVLLTVWVIAAGMFYFGGFFFPAIGGRTAIGTAFYAVMIFVSALTLALRFLRAARPHQ